MPMEFSGNDASFVPGHRPQNSLRTLENDSANETYDLVWVMEES